MTLEMTSPGQLRPSETAEITCAQRAGETLRPADSRLIDDPYARHFITRPVRRALVANRWVARLTLAAFDRRFPGFMAIVLLRNRWYEELLAEALADGVTQVVMLGAGYDTSAWRLDLGDATLFEVDAPPTQRLKQDRMAARGLAPCCDLRYVPCDFERDSLPEQLAEHGFDPGRPSLVVWYGVSFFLTPEAVARTVEDVARLCAPGSVFVLDYLSPDVVAGTSRFTGAERARAAVAARGEPYTCGMASADVDAVLGRHGFAAESHRTMSELAERYGGPRGFRYSRDDFFTIVTARRREAA